jgi:hypothetical protein
MKNIYLTIALIFTIFAKSQTVNLGDYSGFSNTTGVYNVNIGNLAGVYCTTGNANINIGEQAGGFNVQGSNNICIGHNAALNSEQGSNNIIIGSSNFCQSYVGTGKLVIDNGNTQNPLIYGDFNLKTLNLDAKVSIGGIANIPTTAGGINVSNYKLFVKGGILTEEVRVSLTGTWADYVFNKDYKLPTLQEVEKQIQTKGHLFNVPSAKEVAANGIELGEMAKIQQEKIEELTLYLIEQNKVNEKQTKVLEKQGKEIEELKALVNALVSKK